MIKTNIVNSEQCCDVLEIELDHSMFTRWLQEGIGVPGGTYKKKGFLWNDMVVYHNSESNFYLYNSRINHTWLVSI